MFAGRMLRMTCQTSFTSSPPSRAPCPGPPPADIRWCPRWGERRRRPAWVTWSRWWRAMVVVSSAWLMMTCSLWTGSQVNSNCSLHWVTPRVLTARRSPAALSPSDEDREEADSEPDEGIHIPGKFRQNKPLEVAASLPVGIPWPAQLTAARGGDRQRTAGVKGQPGEAVEAGGAERPSDIAASIQVSVISGQNVYPEQTKVNQTLSTYRLWQKVSTLALFLETMYLVICLDPEWILTAKTKNSVAIFGVMWHVMLKWVPKCNYLVKFILLFVLTKHHVRFWYIYPLNCFTFGWTKKI